MKKTAYAILLLIGFASAPAFAETRPADPYEGYNRAVSKFNDQADRYIFAPAARGYRKVTPKPVRAGVSNFFNNLRDVVSFGSNILRLDIKRASEDLVRVGINTTFGLGGLIDIAGAGGVPDNKNTLGDTFASWGWKNSNYFVLPVLAVHRPRRARHGHYLCLSAQEYRFPYPCRTLGHDCRCRRQYARRPARFDRQSGRSRHRQIQLHARPLYESPRTADRCNTCRRYGR